MPAAVAARGVGVSPGRRVGPVVRMPERRPAPAPEPADEGTDLDVAAAAVDTAAAQVRDDLAAAAEHTTGAVAEILATTAAIAADPVLVAEARRRVLETRATPARAVWDAAELVSSQLRALGGVFAERTTDVDDVRDRMVAAILGERAPGVPHPGHPYVLVARDLSPADAARLPSDVVAVVTSGGGPTSHTAILARSLGLPCVVAAPVADELRDGDVVLVDGAVGDVVVDPAEDVVVPVARRLPASLSGPGRTADGHAVHLLANVGDAAQSRAAREAGAEGIGLYRTELAFLGRTTAPTTEEQVATYRAVLAPFAGSRVVVRTLDAGADKPLPFVTADDEPNPALGVRGLRTSWRHPGVLDDQLAAIAEAARAESARVWVMAPMVATAAEAADFVARCAAHGLPQAGVMIEVPAAALRAGQLLAHARFASLGTNDLTQYAMAADRELAPLAALSTAWQPGVLDLIASACAGGRVAERPVGVCGEAAADPALAVVLVGLGASSLSMTARALPEVGAVLASVTLDRCRELAALALAQDDARTAQLAVREALPVLADLGL
ncbi:putative PEP-binding protein [Cellulomonas sp. HZM]|uniref:putative PEP-binding protein n=1 Tax=Cellulomonas sp. HZM TaxID=1454010 RepID=UPI0004937A2E|nr:putative PEP-binding protein [Cellulomonas sp. HZM]